MPHVTKDDKETIRAHYRAASTELRKAMMLWADLNEYAEVSDNAELLEHLQTAESRLDE
jgi:hypothetical protein